jgi:hypothetical protein
MFSEDACIPDFIDLRFLVSRSVPNIYIGAPLD